MSLSRYRLSRKLHLEWSVLATFWEGFFQLLLACNQMQRMTARCDAVHAWPSFVLCEKAPTHCAGSVFADERKQKLKTWLSWLVTWYLLPHKPSVACKIRMLSWWHKSFCVWRGLGMGEGGGGVKWTRKADIRKVKFLAADKACKASPLQATI